MKRTMLVLVGITALLTSGCGDTGNGEKVGVVTRVVANSGVFCKTNEVEIMRGGMNAGTGVVGSAFHVTVQDPEMFKQLQAAMESQKEIKIKYRKEFFTWCSSDSPENAFATSVEDAHPVGVDRPVPVQANVKVEGVVKTAPATSEELRADKVDRLLKVQAELISELAKDRK